MTGWGGFIERAEARESVIKPLRGNILDIGGSIRIPDKEKPMDFHKVREETKKMCFLTTTLPDIVGVV